ncbi:hypothetical protein VNO80_05152 [Phaseolus coccineus]|uniref:Uncharacterized protein n=1 Tax=Phaseolus coccineus TaxID=3886 RepID=A0AAN9NF80_PHACN
MYVIAMKLVIYRYENSLLSTFFAVIVYRVKENGSVRYFPLPNPNTHMQVESQVLHQYKLSGLRSPVLNSQFYSLHLTFERMDKGRISSGGIKA